MERDISKYIVYINKKHVCLILYVYIYIYIYYFIDYIFTYNSIGLLYYIIYI